MIFYVMCLQSSVPEWNLGLRLKRRQQGSCGEAGKKKKLNVCLIYLTADRGMITTFMGMFTEVLSALKFKTMLVCPFSGAGGEQPTAEGEGGWGSGQAGRSQCGPGQWWRRQLREGLERGRPPAAHQGCQSVPRWNQRQVNGYTSVLWMAE